MKNSKIALVHDYLNQYGGGERVVEAIHEIWPEAFVYTSIYDKNLMKQWLKIPEGKIKTNLVSRLPFANYLTKHYFFMYPIGFSFQDVGDVDVVISSSSYAAKFVKPPKDAIHICYLHTVPRFLWGYDTELSRYYHRPFDRFLAPLYEMIVPGFKKILRRFDYKAAQKIDYFIANSKEVQGRIKKHYHRDSVVIYPPVDTDRFNNIPAIKENDYYLVVSRLGGYKKVDIVVEAFNELGLPLKIVGVGPQLEYLRKIAKDNVEVLGRVSDAEVTNLLINCKALVFPTLEDFGIVPVEAMAAGKPVIAFRGGGALETIEENITGIFFDEQTANAIIRAVQKFKTENFDPEECRKQSAKFSKEVFKQNIESFVKEALSKKSATTSN